MVNALTKYTVAGGCSCKIPPDVLGSILEKSGINQKKNVFENLIVGSDTRDDAAVISIGDNQGIISTTDFFTPIVDDAYIFGKIAATNALSDVYAMGGKPLMAISIFCWPINKLPLEQAAQVLAGARSVCENVKIPLCGGHSINTIEPVFGLAVTGSVDLSYIKRNSTAKPGNNLYLTKPIGLGILAAAKKRGILDKYPDYEDTMVKAMTKLNSVGTKLGTCYRVTAMTDVTGFGFFGHLISMCIASKVSAKIFFNKIPMLQEAFNLVIKENCVPGQAYTTYETYKNRLRKLVSHNTTNSLSKLELAILFSPETSGGLLIAADNDTSDVSFDYILREHDLQNMQVIGQIEELHDSEAESYVEIIF